MFPRFVSLESLPDCRGEMVVVDSGLVSSPAGPTCGKVEGPLSPCGGGQTPKKGPGR